MTRAYRSVAIVVPWLHGIRGHRISVGLARELSAQGTPTEFFVGRLFEGLAPWLRAGLGGAALNVGREVRSGETSILEFARHQYSRSLDRELARTIAARHAVSPFDLVFVISNEGHGLASYLRRYIPSSRPLLAVCVRELVEHPFWLGYERKWRRARALFSSLYPLAHEYEAERLRTFDRVYSNSPWTSGLLDYFYGIRVAPTFALVDRMFYEAPRGPPGSDYIAVPTASLDAEGTRTVQSIGRRVPGLRTFGKKAVPGLPHAGFLSDPELVSFLAGARATLFVFDYEALGLIPLESLAVGTPVVTIPKQGPWATLAGNPWVRFGTTADELARALEELRATPPTGEDVREICRRSVISFHPDRAIEGLWESLRDDPRSRYGEGSAGGPGAPEARAQG